MPIPLFQVLHVFSVVCLVGVALAAFAAPLPERRKAMMKWSGIASLGVFLTGFGLLGMLKYGWPGWALVKIVCWLLLSAIVGQAFRRPEQTRSLVLCSLALAVLALSMVYFRPF